jgi:proline iminopeptidase
MFVSLGGQRIFFDVVGAILAPDGPVMRERPTLIVMHGGPGFDHSGLRGAFDTFADIAQVLYIDHRGNGRSVPSDPATWTLAQWGDDVRALCEALGIEKPIVFGQSFGGMVAQAYATRHPGHARALILSSTAARMDLPASLDLFEAKGGREARAIAERF